MQKLFQLLLCALFLVPSAIGYSHEVTTEDTSCNTNCCLPVRFGAELLYFKPTTDQSSYVVTSVSNADGDEFFPSGKRHHNRPNYKPGFRLEAAYDLCDSNAIDARFTYFRAGHHASTSGDFLFDTIGFPGEGAQAPEDTSYNGRAKIHDRLRYYAADLTLNRLSLCSCVDNLYLLFGLHYANIRHRTHFKSTGDFLNDGAPVAVDNRLRSRSHFWGIGPQIGLEYTYCLPQCCLGNFALHANMRAALLCSKNKASFHYNSVRTARTLGVNLKNDHVWRVNPAFDARLGGSYDFCFCGHTGTIEIGYEWLWYHNSVDSIFGYDVAFPGDTIDLYNNLSLQGPYLKIGINF